jgi:outer membrane protein assembly factor BamB
MGWLRAVLLGSVIWLHAARGADWPRFLGPNGDATSPETNLLARLPTNGPPVRWSRAAGPGYSAPSVRAGRAYLFHREGDHEVLAALHTADGRELWRHVTPTRYRDPYGYNNGPRGTPLVTSNRVFTFGAEGRLTAVDPATGRPLWQRDTAKDFEVPEAFFGVGSTPVLEGDRLLVMVGGQPDAAVVAFDPATGRTLWAAGGERNWTGQPMLGWPGERRVEWRRWEKQASYASPHVATVNGERVLFAFLRQGLVALNPTNGAVKFSRWFRARVDESVNAMTPVTHGAEVLISSAYYRSGSVLLRLGADNAAFTEPWQGLGLEMHWSQPLLVNGCLYGFSGRNEPDAALRCVEWATGRVRWERSERWAPHSAEQPPVFGRGAFLHADGKLIALGEGGLLGWFRPDPDRCEELGRWQVPDLHYPCWTGPVLSDGHLYLRGEDRLVCLDVRQRH